jgi:hypothetical protein
MAASRPAGGLDPARETARPAAGKKARKTASKSASKSASGKMSRPVRRRGRPRGPERVPLSVRIRPEVDDALTLAVDESGLGPQEIVEQALAVWLTEHGYTSSGRR